MKILFDTSVLVAALVESHPDHARALPWLAKAKRGEVGYLVSCHTMAELYAVLSSLPLKPRISPGLARRLVQENVEGAAGLVALSASDYREALGRAADLGLSGGVIYDGLIAQAAVKSRADRLLTLDVDDFRRVWPEGEGKLAAP